MEIAATVMLNGLFVLLTITILTIEIAATVVLNGLFVLPCGFMYSQSPLGRHLLGRRLPPLHTLS